MLTFPIAAVMSQYFFGITIFLVSTFLVLLVLVQRGRGGGLAGALGGPGGGSVFGSKAGDVFTKITVGTAAVWIFLCALAVWWMQENKMPLSDNVSPSTSGMGGDGLELPTGSSPTGGLEPAGIPSPVVPSNAGSEGALPEATPTTPAAPADTTPTPPPAVPVTPPAGEGTETVPPASGSSGN